MPEASSKAKFSAARKERWRTWWTHQATVWIWSAARRNKSARSRHRALSWMGEPPGRNRSKAATVPHDPPLAPAGHPARDVRVLLLRHRSRQFLRGRRGDGRGDRAGGYPQAHDRHPNKGGRAVRPRAELVHGKGSGPADGLNPVRIS